jgi:hypothetical protein
MSLPTSTQNEDNRSDKTPGPSGVIFGGTGLVCCDYALGSTKLDCNPEWRHLARFCAIERAIERTTDLAVDFSRTLEPYFLPQML